MPLIFRPIELNARAISTLVAFADVYLQNLDTTGPQGPNVANTTGRQEWQLEQ
jgi:hypothetical protein